MSATGVADLVLPVVIVVVLAVAWIAVAVSGARHERTALRARKRARRSYYAAVEAAEDDPVFAPETIERSVVRLVMAADSLWLARQDDTVDGLPDAAVVRAWASSRQAWLGAGLHLVGTPRIDLLRIVHRNRDEDRVVVRIRLRVRCRHPRSGPAGRRHVRLDERWTLGRCADDWVVLSVDGNPLTGPIIDAPLIVGRASDTGRLLEESLTDLAREQQVDDADLKDLVASDKLPALAMLDLSSIDERFLPPLIAAELVHLLEAWADAVSGSEAPLVALAAVVARDSLLRPVPGRRFVMRDPVLRSWRTMRLDLARQPPAIDLRLEVEAVRYLAADRESGQQGRDDGRSSIRLTWRLELTDWSRPPWRLVSSTSPTESIPGWSSAADHTGARW